jgi:hypothetical protein
MAFMKTHICISVLLTMLGCSSPNDIKQTVLASDYFPLSIGNKWYYTYFVYPTGYDSTKIYEIDEIVAMKSIVDEWFFAMQIKKLDFHDTTHHTYIAVDTIYLRARGSTIVYADSALSGELQKIVYADFNLKDGEILDIYMERRWGVSLHDTVHYSGKVSSRSGPTITLYYDRPGWIDAEHFDTFEKGIGPTQYEYVYGTRMKLVQYQISE